MRKITIVNKVLSIFEEIIEKNVYFAYNQRRGEV